jgi:hypothetical protein
VSKSNNTRTATCVCGALSVECGAEPISVSLCSCSDCQRRTGSAFGIAAFFERGDVEMRGDAACFEHRSDAGHEFNFHFCPACATTLYWETDARPGIVIVAAGAFADPDFPAPARSHYDEQRHPWLHFSFD